MILDEARKEHSDDLVSRQTVKRQMIKYGFHAPDMTSNAMSLMWRFR